MIEQTLDYQRGICRVNDTVDMILLLLFGIVGGARSIRCQNRRESCDVNLDQYTN